MKKLFLISLLVSLLITVSVPVLALSPNDALKAIGGPFWKDKNGEAYDFRFGGHDFRLWKPTIVMAKQNFKVSFKMDHKLAKRNDDHWYVTIKYVNGECSTDIICSNGGNIFRIPGTSSIARMVDEEGWEKALRNVIDSIRFAYCLD